MLSTEPKSEILGGPLAAEGPEATKMNTDDHLQHIDPPPPQASVSPGSFALSKCFLPEESTVIGVYCSAGAGMLLLFLAHCLWMKGLLQCLSLCLLGKHKYL